MSKSIFPATAMRTTPDLGGDLGLLGAVAQAPSRISATLLLWHMRSRQRTQLAAMESHRLEDIGVSAGAARREANKPFWRA